MVATPQNDSNELDSQRKKGFHAKYLAICKAKNIQPLPEVKMKQKNNHVLDFHADRVKVSDWMAICSALESDRSLKLVAIRLRKNDGIVAETIDTQKKAKAVVSYPVIYSKFIFMEFLNALQRMLEMNSQLEILMLEGLPIYGRYMTHLVKGLCTNRSLKVLSLARSSIGDEACEILCSNIKHMANIDSVNLSQCGLGVKGATAIREFVHFQKIHRLSEAWICSLRYRTFEPSSFNGVRKIFLNNNPLIGDEGLKVLIDELREDVWLKEIEMQNCGLTSVGANLIISSLEENKTILNFNINNNSDVPEHLLRHIMIHLGSSSCDTESSDSSDCQIARKVSKSQLLDNIKYMKDQFESAIFRQKELEKVNAQLHKQIVEIKNELSIQSSSFNVPDGYTLVADEELNKLLRKKPVVVPHRKLSNIAVRLRRKKMLMPVTKVKSLDFEEPRETLLPQINSERNISVDVKPKEKLFVEKNIGDRACENNDDGLEILRLFTKKKSSFASMRSLTVPSNSDADSDE